MVHNNSETAFCAPYDVKGVVKKLSGIFSGKGAPNTAIELVNTNLGK